MTFIETPEEALRQIFLRLYTRPDATQGQTWQSADYRAALQAWFGERLSRDFFVNGSFFMLDMMLRDGKSPATLPIPDPVVLNNDAYFYMHSALVWLVREADACWKLRLDLSMCWGCFGDHTEGGGLLCVCCGGTGWEGGDLEFGVPRALRGSATPDTPLESPRAAFLRLREMQLPILQPLQGVPKLEVFPTLIRGTTAKLLIQTANEHYMALLHKPAQDWQLSTFLPLCLTCNGENPAWSTTPCPDCLGYKWGKAGDLHYCYNRAAGWWQSEPWD